MRKSTLNVTGKKSLWVTVMLILSIAMVGAAILSVTMVMVPVSVSADEHPAQAMWVDPGSYLTAPELDSLKEDDTFTVDVMINVTDPDPINSPPDGLFGFDYHLTWDKNNLVRTNYTINIPPEWTNYFVAADSVGDYNATHKYHWVGVSALAPSTFFAGVMSICTYDFEVNETIYDPYPDEIGGLLLQDTKLADDQGNPIVHTAYDGEYRKCAQPIPPPELRVVPEETRGIYGELFNVSIEVRFLTKVANMCRWNATLSYDTTMLDAKNSFEGPLLPKFKGPGGTNYTYVINESLGTVYTTGFFVGPPVSPPNETGVLAIIEFNATWQYTVSPTMIPPITSSLGLYNTNFVNCANLTIPALPPRNATYTAPYKPEVLVHPIEWSPASGVYYYVVTESNSSVSPVPMIFDQPAKSLIFNVTGTADYHGFCNVTIPKVLLNATWNDWMILLDEITVIPPEGSGRYTHTDNTTHSSLYFTYALSTHRVRIEGTTVIPEFPIAMILPLLLIATLTAAILGKKARAGKRRELSVAE